MNQVKHFQLKSTPSLLPLSGGLHGFGDINVDCHAMVIFTRPAATLLPLFKPQTDPPGLFPWPFSPRVIFLVDPALPHTLFVTSLPVSVPVGYSGLCCCSAFMCVVSWLCLPTVNKYTFPSPCGEIKYSLDLSRG